MSGSDLTGADWAAATVAIPHTTSTETAACRNNVFIMARIVDRGVGGGKSAVSLAAYLRGAGRAEAADPRAGRHAQLVASARRLAGDRSVDRRPRPYTSTSESIRSSGMISPVFFAPALIALYSSVARRTRLPS